MVYGKCVLAGVGAAMLAALLYFVLAVGYLFLKTRADYGGGFSYGFDFHVHPPSLGALGAALLVFGAGFYWQYRRAR
jgi:hypothetical protein